MTFNGLVTGMSDLARLSDARTRSISAENPDGARGRGDLATEGTGLQAARDLGQGWKVSPSIRIDGGAAVTLADIAGPGAIQHIWFAVSHGSWRQMVIRFYWDGEDRPSIEVPFGDFFCSGWNRHSTISSLAIAVNPIAGFNSYWQMPFRKQARVTLENIGEETITCYYQITWAETDIPDDAACLHAQWRRNNPLPYGEVHTLLDGVTGQGHYVGTYMAWGSNNSGWWGEGEIKFYMDGDEHPTICAMAAHRHRGLFRRSVGLPNDRRRLWRIQFALFRDAPGAAAGWLRTEPDPLRAVPLAHSGPDSLSGRPACHHPGAGLAQRQSLPAAAG